MVKLKAIQNWQMRVTRKMKMSTVKRYVVAVEEITVQMSSGLAVTSVKGGTMGSA